MALNRTPRGTEPWDDEMWANLTYLDTAKQEAADLDTDTGVLLDDPASDVATKLSANFVARSLVTTKGDLLAASASGTVARLGVGANAAPTSQASRHKSPRSLQPMSKAAGTWATSA